MQGKKKKKLYKEFIQLLPTIHHSGINKTQFCRKSLELTIFFTNCKTVYISTRGNQLQKDCEKYNDYLLLWHSYV